ncbi:Zinc finger, GRF-type [Sesbania bispinosa]|nr:Zinc finger, GRF-type [Sesbania bispinosa]
MANCSMSSSSSALSRKRCGCGDEVVLFTAGSRAKNPGKKFCRCPNWKSCGLLEWVEEEENQRDFAGRGCCHSHEMLIETLKLKNASLQRKLENERNYGRLTKNLLFMCFTLLAIVCLWCLLKCQCVGNHVV